MIAIVLALGASLMWGFTNFVGGLQARQLALLTVLLVSQAVGLATIAMVVLVRGVPAPDAETIATAAATGVVSACALVVFFRALTVGKFSVVMPIIAASATVPVIVGIGRGERPSALQAAGIVAVIVGLAVSARPSASEEGPAGRLAEGVALALVAIVLVGLVLIGIDRAAADDPYWAVFILRIATFSSIALVALAGAHLPIAPRGNIGRLVLLGLLDISGFILFSVATTKGFLSVVAVLGSMHPVVTVAAAWFGLGERMGRIQWVGVALTFVGVALVVAG